MCVAKEYDLPHVLESILNATGKSLVTGEVFLLYLNAYTACVHGDKIKNMDDNATLATKLAAERGLTDYLRFLSMSRPSYYGRFSHSFFEKLDPRRSFSAAAALAKNIPFDPVIYEALHAFPYTRRLAKEALINKRCSLPTSYDIDEMYRNACARYIDYLVYRRYGLDAAMKTREDCLSGADVSYSLGSIADIVGVALYYYFNECFANFKGPLQKLTALFL